MSRTLKRMISMASATLVLALAGAAHADGVAVGPSALSQTARTALERSVQKARAADASAFSQLADLRTELPALDANKRGRLASITPPLRAMGKRALMPMLAELALDAAPRGKLTDTAWRAWRVALLEAVGSLRDARSRAVLIAILDSGESDLLVVRAAAQALGKEGSDAAVRKLISLSDNLKGGRRRAVLSGMGHCRRQKIAERLAVVLGASSDTRDARVLAHALGDVGSAWAWETPAVSKSGEGDATRATAAEALLEGFIAFDDVELRERFTQAILVVDWQGTKAVIAAARKGASSELDAALDRLDKRFDDSPLH